jgi:cytochrome c peroxidase
MRGQHGSPRSVRSAVVVGAAAVLCGGLVGATLYQEPPEPVLPPVPYTYAAPLPTNLVRRTVTARSGVASQVGPTDNTPATNPITDAGATLGRVLFYDVRLSANNRVSCGSCHIQEFGFSDTARFSVGLNGERTKRHSMALANARFYPSGRYFWDERAATLEDQVLMPIQDKVEMGMSLDVLVPKLKATRFYPGLFEAAFGSPDITSERVARGLAQFIRSMVSTGSFLDRPAAGGVRLAGTPGVRLDVSGATIFSTQCATCHLATAHELDAPHNTGLDSTITDPGAGEGRFKAPSLRNVAVRPPYMHDGRFKTLEEVIAFYDTGIKNNPSLDKMLRNKDSSVSRMNLTAQQRASLLAYLQLFTDSTLLTAPKYSNPFPKSK